MASLIRELENLGGGIFLSHKGVDRRLKEDELWQAFEKPLMIWIHGKGQALDNESLNRILDIVGKFPDVRRFRLTNTRLTNEGLAKLRETWPNAVVQ